ncbi:MAG: ABC transporter permease [Candidatus Aureabacteria bacterium]|nr:ABC transporter permease [Candidatus Auribacterota bacterium]
MQHVGQALVIEIAAAGRFSLTAFSFIKKLYTSPPRFRIIIQQLYEIGYRSLPVVAITGAFTGMVLAVQSFYQFHQISMETAIGILIGLSMTNELGPVLTALMVAGRVGASMAAQLGTMKVTEQVDALETLAVDPVGYLVVPRLIAGIFMIPILTVFSIFIGILGGYGISVYLLKINKTFFMSNMLDYTKAEDLCNGLIKSVVFAVLIIVISCYKGMTAGHGAEGVGRATTEAVVASCISILITDFFLSIILY